jgi:hypothetical protein
VLAQLERLLRGIPGLREQLANPGGVTLDQRRERVDADIEIAIPPTARTARAGPGRSARRARLRRAGEFGQVSAWR